jgi:phage baseplate assembly protein gpV
MPKLEGDERTPSVNALARGTNTLTKTVSVKGSPAEPYGAVYPNNKVTQTSSGHTIEIDDTSGAERINIHHKSGAFIEFHPDGSVVVKTTNVYIDAGTNANIKATNVDVEATKIDVNGSTVNINGGSGDVVVNGISLVNHTHRDNPGLAGAVTSKPL